MNAARRRRIARTDKRIAYTKRQQERAAMPVLVEGGDTSRNRQAVKRSSALPEKKWRHRKTTRKIALVSRRRNRE